MSIEEFDPESLRTSDESSSQMRRLLDSSHHGSEEESKHDTAVIGIHTAFALLDGCELEDDEDEVTTQDEIEDDGHSYYYGSSSVIIIHICSYLAFVSVFGIDSLSYNPLIGPPVQSIEDYGAKNPIKVKDECEYWRIVTAMFINVGFLDLFFSISMLYYFGRCLERKWGCVKWLSVYLISGLGGNIYSSLTEQTATSVGNGGCVLGLLGAMHVDFATNILLFQGSENKYESNISLHDDSFLTCALAMIGLFIGIITVAITEHIGGGKDQSQNLIMHKDWSVLYGGMLTGIIFTCIWNICTITSFLATKEAQNFNDEKRRLARIELFLRLMMLIMPLLVLQLIFTMT